MRLRAFIGRLRDSIGLVLGACYVVHDVQSDLADSAGKTDSFR